MKKLLSFLIVLGALCAVTSVRADRQYQLCDPLKSTLCGGLASLYEFEETSDYVRTSETGGRLIEPDGANVARSSTHKTGTYSLDHTAVANSYLYVPRSSGPTGQFSASFWLYATTLPSATTKRVQILSTRDVLGNEGYPRVYLLNTTGTTRLQYEVKQGITDTVTVLNNSSQSISASTWYHVMYGQYPNADSTHPYQRTLWIQVNAGTRDVVQITNADVATYGDFIVGGWLNTSPTEYGAYKIDQLAAWGGTFSTGGVSRLYNSGTGCAFPFVATATVC